MLPISQNASGERPYLLGLFSLQRDLTTTSRHALEVLISPPILSNNRRPTVCQKSGLDKRKVRYGDIHIDLRVVCEPQQDTLGSFFIKNCRDVQAK